ncbi:MAG: MMPL family transporter, partial [bacterium]
MSTFIVKFRKFFMAAFLVALIVAGVLQSRVAVNYDLTDYLPADSEFMAAYALSGEQFGTSSVIRMMVGEVSNAETVVIRENLLAIAAVKAVVINDYDPAADAVLFTITFQEGMTNAEAIAAVDDIRTCPTGKPVYLSGSLINHLAIQESSAAESLRTVLLLIPIILIILLLTSTSWIEPLISLMVILVAIVISMGTNVIFVDGISFITKSILAALTMAISMDYSIFLLHAFKDARRRGLAPAAATIDAIKSSFTTITVSSLTTVAGFAALLVMRFTLGGDMGLVFAKAILIALLTVLFLMPGLLMLSYRWIEKTAHKEWLPSFKKLGAFAVRHRLAILILAVV